MFFEPEMASPGTPLLRSADIFREGAMLELGLTKDSGHRLWVIGVVIRARIIQHDYLDVGIRFCERCINTDEFGLS